MNIHSECTFIKFTVVFNLLLNYIGSTGYDINEQKKIKVTRNGSCEVSQYNDKTKQIDCLKCKGININGKCEWQKYMKHCISNYKDIVCSVCEDKYYEEITCKTCGEHCRRCKNEKECVLCSDGYKLNEKGLCEENSKVIQNKIVQCSTGEYPFNATCYSCKDKDNHSEECNYKETFICSTSDYSNGVCSNENKGINSSNSNGDICNKGYYNINNTCKTCKTTYGECKQCDSTQCHECEKEYYISNGKCIYNENKCIITESKCIRCINSSEWYKTGECSICTENCHYCINNTCVECNNGFIIYNRTCINNKIDECINYTLHDCSRCLIGYYYNSEERKCNKCNETCHKCYNETTCLECKKGYYLNENNECETLNKQMESCKHTIPGNPDKCAICKNRYYRDQTYCKKCINNCSICFEENTCIKCEDEYFLLTNTTQCISYNKLINCKTKTHSGCIECENKYYINKQYCSLCSETIKHCSTCSNGNQCNECENEYVRNGEYKYIYYKEIKHCKKSNSSKCSKCSFLHQ